MSLFDRYVIRVFLRILAVSFMSMTGLFIVIDLFGNLEEFLSHAERQGGLLRVLIDYYGARIFWFFDRTSSLLALMAAIFTVTSFHRSNELTAVMAAGISRARAVRVLIIATILIALMAAANRELALPKMRDKLTRNAQNWLGETAKPMTAQRDHCTRVLIGGKETIAAEKKIIQPILKLPSSLSDFGRQMVAESAVYRSATSDHPNGYLLNNVSQPDNLAELPSSPVEADTEPILLTPKDHPWLEEGQCFMASEITFEQVAADNDWQQYSSTLEIVQALQNPSLDYGADSRVIVHRRLVQPILDVTLLFVGLPLVLSRSHRNMFVAAGQCLLLVGAFFITALACQAMGNTVLISPALAAWIPLMIFVPLAYTVAARRWE